MDLAVENVETRNEELKQLESDLGDLHTLFKDVATLASMQQEVIARAPRPTTPPCVSWRCVEGLALVGAESGQYRGCCYGSKNLNPRP
ncbi:hypothetical protein T484DRAFT_2657263 [Baffinella frigidus]|nr:hypothetical protein T484DRAFT_2657263 [Cryptophyta sp. CCMP2293]